jgi:hypothetical protein
MGWQTTTDAGKFFALADGFLCSQAVENTVLLSVAESVLFTDLANPTSNALYQKIGYRPVSDRVVLSYSPA